MEIDVTTPALLFPAISLLLLAFTNRFLALAALIRNLHDRYQARPDELIVAQIGNLRYRVMLIKNMQAFGVLSLLLCVLCMFVLFAGNMLLGKAIFAQPGIDDDLARSFRPGDPGLGECFEPAVEGPRDGCTPEISASYPASPRLPVGFTPPPSASQPA